MPNSTEQPQMIAEDVAKSSKKSESTEEEKQSCYVFILLLSPIFYEII